MADSLPRLKSAQVSALAAKQSFQKGERYFRNRAIAHPVRQGNTLRAECSGTYLYRVSATLSAQGIESSSCTCPYDWGGICKHEVALLLTYIHEPERFQVIQPLAELLAERSRDDLLHLIEQMIQRYPDLIDIVDAPSMPTTGQLLDLANYQRQVERAFQAEEMHTMASGLESLTSHGDRLRQQKDWIRAGEIYQLLLETANEQYDYSVLDIDYNGEVACVIQNIAEGLSVCLEQAESLDGDQRHRWVETLFEAVLKDIELGGMDYAYPASDTIAQHTTDADWTWLEPRIREQIQTTGQNACSDWGRQRLVGLLTERAAQQGNDQTAEAVILELGTPQQQAFFHLENRNLEEAVAIARSHFKSWPGLVTKFADGLLAADAPDLALRFVQDCADGERYGYQEWLAQFYREYGQTEQFLVAQVELLKTRFTPEGYQELRTQAESLENWQSLRQILISTLAKNKRYDCVIDIALLEQDWEAALRHLQQVSRWHRAAYQEKVAAKVQADQPETAIALYREMIEALIDQRGRDNYRKAAQYLQNVQRLYEQLQQEDTCRQYLQELRSQHSNLPALKQELSKAGF
ncbi:MAG: SWIM zinc finger family protein [Leptolyngbyaceae cyanobacterium]